MFSDTEAPRWMKHAGCKGKTEIFYPVRHTTASVKAARDICNVCVVLSTCEEHALTRPEIYGFWAGHTEKELRKMRARRRILVSSE